jgi:hypothetical protein
MANNIRFYRKSVNESEDTAKDTSEDALDLNVVDAEICVHFKHDTHPKDWYYNWFNAIAFWLALGKTWDETRAITEDQREYFTAMGDKDDIVNVRLKIIDFMESRYLVNTWVTVGK